MICARPVRASKWRRRDAMIPIPIENAHARLERGFADAILSDDAPIPASVQLASGPATASRFSVYRNNVMASLLNALAQRYPVARKILWPDTFDGAARLFVTLQPPRSPVLLHYGDGFPQFLRHIGQGAVGGICRRYCRARIRANAGLSHSRRNAASGRSVRRRLARRSAASAIGAASVDHAIAVAVSGGLGLGIRPKRSGGRTSGGRKRR